MLEESDIPNCIHFGNDVAFARSPPIPVIVERIRVPMTLDTGAEVTILSSSFLQNLFPGRELPGQGREVRSLGGNHIAIKGPVRLAVEICGMNFNHPVYVCDKTFLSGYDVVSAAALLIDAQARCVWSKLTVHWGITQDFTNSSTPSIVDPQITTHPPPLHSPVTHPLLR